MFLFIIFGLLGENLKINTWMHVDLDVGSRSGTGIDIPDPIIVDGAFLFHKLCLFDLFKIMRSHLSITSNSEEGKDSIKNTQKR